MRGPLAGNAWVVGGDAAVGDVVMSAYKGFKK